MPKPNVLIESKKRKANQLAAEQRFEEALELFQSVCQKAPLDIEAWAKSSELFKRSGRFAEAEACARKAVGVNPRHPIAQFALGSALHCRDAIEEAVSHYREALKADPNYVDCLYLFGKGLDFLGQTDEAERHLRRTIELKPDFTYGLASVAGLMVNRGELDAAQALLERSLAVDSRHPETLHGLAIVAERQGRDEEAMDYYRRTLNARPTFYEAVAGYASCFERRGQVEEAEAILRDALQRAPNHAALNQTMAKIDRRFNRWDVVASRTQTVLSSKPALPVAASAQMLLGQALDRLERTDEAYAHFEEGNRLTCLAQGISDIAALQRDYMAHVRWTASSLSPELAAAPRAEYRGPTPVFLIGFPRSGTTLLEQILDAHPRLQTVEEAPMVNLMGEAFERLVDGDARRLSELNDEALQELRAVYFDTLKHHAQPQPEKLIVDKLPLNTIWTPLIWRVFPDAKFIFALRHPYDACLSCFMQDFQINRAMSSFVSLEKTVELYDMVMSLWQHSLKTLPLRAHTIRYEDLVGDFDGEVKRLLDFLELPWDESIRLHRERSMKKKIDTPSYHQVTQPIYKDAMYRWKRYAKYLEPYASTLEPYARLFGYL